MIAEAKSLPSLSLSRTIAAPRERVFRAWTEPAELKKWWGPPGFTTPVVELDLRVGGAYRMGMQPPQGEMFYLRGVFREVSPPAKLVYTWNWENSAEFPGETLVTVEFRERGRATEVVVTHEGFPTAPYRDRHTEGWNATLDRLPALF